MSRYFHFSFKLIWLISTFAFGCFAFEAQQSEKIILPRYANRISNVGRGMTIQLGGVNFQDVITIANGIADTHDKSVEALEKSIRSSARLSFRLNLLCAFAAFIGFITQFGQYLHEQSNNSKNGRI
jgi:hypothetical protein